MESEETFGPAFKGTGNAAKQDSKTKNPGAFGSVAEHFADRGIDLNEQLVRNKSATYFFRMKGDAMREAGIFDNDLLVVDRSVKAVNGKIIVVVLNGELLVRRFHKNYSSSYLIPENTRYKPINLAEFSDLVMWGVVTYVIHQV